MCDRRKLSAVIFLLLGWIFSSQTAGAAMPLRSWTFDDANWLSDGGFPPVAFTNVANIAWGDGNSLQVDTNTTAFMQA